MVLRPPRPSPYSWFVEGALNLAAFCSLVVVVAGVLTRGPGLIAGGCVVGGLGLGLGLVMLGRSLASQTALTAALAIVVADVAILVVMWATT